MRKVTFRALADSKKELEDLLLCHDLRLQSDSWLYRAYRITEELADIYSDDFRRRKFLEKENGEGDVWFSLHDVFVLYEILPYVKGESKDLLKRKLQRVLKMSSPPLESLDNNEARNTLWELKLFSYLKKANVDASLGDPNPDIFASINGRNYYFQCKRVFSPSPRALRDNISSAARQLRVDLLGKSHQSLGLLALSLDRPLTGGNLMLVADSEQAAREKLVNALEEVRVNFGHVWQDPGLIQSQAIVGIILHLAVPGVVEQENIFAPGSQTHIKNTWADGRGFQFIKNDLEPLGHKLS